MSTMCPRPWANNHYAVTANVSTKLSAEGEGKGCIGITWSGHGENLTVMIEAEDASGLKRRSMTLDVNRKGAMELRATLDRAL